jgi:hypothetical protein
VLAVGVLETLVHEGIHVAWASQRRGMLALSASYHGRDGIRDLIIGHNSPPSFQRNEAEKNQVESG